MRREKSSSRARSHSREVRGAQARVVGEARGVVREVKGPPYGARGGAGEVRGRPEARTPQRVVKPGGVTMEQVLLITTNHMSIASFAMVSNSTNSPQTHSYPQLLSMSSATIPDNMTMSCTSMGDMLGEGETEKEGLLRRLRELLEVEGRQTKDDLASKKKALLGVEERRRGELERLKEEHRKEEEEVLRRQMVEREEQGVRHQGEEERIGVEIHKLEEELERLQAPSQLLNSLSTSQPSPTPRPEAKVTLDPAPAPAPAPPPPRQAELSELEQELQCCACSRVCGPPTLIYQCPEGDLICGNCKTDTLAHCPSCRYNRTMK